MVGPERRVNPPLKKAIGDGVERGRAHVFQDCARARSRQGRACSRPANTAPRCPYTSMNGNMYSYLGENGVGLPADVREEFLARYQTTLYHAYGIVQKEYVTVPTDLLAKTDELAPYFRVSFDYAKTLRPKSAKRAPKS